MHIGPQIKQAVWRVFTDYALLNHLPYWCILMNKIDILYDVVGVGTYLLYKVLFIFQALRRAGRKGRVRSC